MDVSQEPATLARGSATEDTSGTTAPQPPSPTAIRPMASPFITGAFKSRLQLHTAAKEFLKAWEDHIQKTQEIESEGNPAKI